MSGSAAIGHGQPPGAGTLTAWLRERSDEQLAELLRRRPDLALPAPADLAALTGRVSVRTSVQRALDGLDTYTLRVLELLVIAADETDSVDLGVARGLAGDTDLTPGVSELLDVALCWGEPDAPRLVPMVREVVGPYPAGLGRPVAQLTRGLPDVLLAAIGRNLGLPPASGPRAAAAVAATLADPVRLAALLDQCDETELDVLDRLATGAPRGVVRNAQLPQAEDAVPSPHRLISRGLLIPVDPHTVELPREVGLAVRGQVAVTVGRYPQPMPVVERSPAELDRLGCIAVLDALRHLETLAESWTRSAPPQLRAGGVGMRDLRRTARDLGTDEPTAALLAEVGFAAGLIGVTTAPDSVYLPTPDYDGWRQQSAAARWLALASAWLGMTRQPCLVGQRGDRDRLITALGSDAERATAPALRAQALAVLADLGPGASPANRAAVLDRLAWQAPRRANPQRPSFEAILAEADLLGLTAAGGLTGYSRTLLDGSRDVAQQVLDSALPQPVDHLLVQPDLTLIVPGPPVPELAAELALLADLESTGGAFVYRVTPASVRRALDAGRSGEDLLNLLGTRSRTPIPQALDYLITDAAKRHGTLRAGTASAYLRCDDAILLDRVVADRNVESLHLTRLAPTVAITTAPVARLLEVLRSAGFAPAAESTDGTVVSLEFDAPRAPSRSTLRAVRVRSAAETAGQLTELIRRMRSGDSLAEVTSRVTSAVGPVPGVTSATTMGVLREAIRDGSRVLLGYVDADGNAASRSVYPISMAGGTVRGHESGSSGLQSFALHRITAVTVVHDEQDADGA